MNMKNYETIALSEPAEHILVATLNRPEVSNAVNTQMGRDILALMTEVNEAPRHRCMILTGAGQRAFSAGGDLKERRGMTDEQWRAQHAIFERGFAALIACPIPIIAAVNGAAFGGGCELSLCCDFIYASTTARFALTEVSLGIMPGGGGTQTLARAVGERRAKELILSAVPFSAQDAAAWGMVNRLCEPAELMPQAIAIAERIARNAPLSVRQAKKSIHHGLQMDLTTGLAFEIEAYNYLVPTADRREGVLAFGEKRPPRFVGA